MLLFLHELSQTHINLKLFLIDLKFTLRNLIYKNIINTFIVDTK